MIKSFRNSSVNSITDAAGGRFIFYLVKTRATREQNTKYTTYQLSTEHSVTPHDLWIFDIPGVKNNSC